ncbi:hypothetical protein [Pandoraea pnomenusa]|uniref:hypothetical protein n=1 Tax=Pandoraea pnomenusa TaxID=93220 RepID=UPI00334088FC
MNVTEKIAGILTLLICLLPCAQVSAETVTVAPVGDYATIDTQRTNQALQVFAKGTPLEKRAAADEIVAHSENYAPPVFYALSQALFEDGKQDEGAFWFYAGQLRARFDANRCADKTAKSAVSGLNNRYGPLINQYMFKDVSKLEALIPEVVAWDRKTPHSYDHRWINLHGMAAMMAGLNAKSGLAQPSSAMSLPQEQWERIAEQTRLEYMRGFQEAMAAMKNKQ